MLQPATPKRLLTIDEAARVLSISRSSCYRLVMAGALRSLKLGNLRRVRPEAIETFLNRAEKEQDEEV